MSAMPTTTATALPDGWRVVRLGDVADVVMGQSPPGNTVVDWNGDANGEGLPFIQGNAEFGSTVPSPVKWCVSPAKTALPDDLLISVRAPVGETNRADRRLGIGRGLAAIRFKDGEQAYGWHILNHAKGAFARLAQGSTFEAISGSDLRSLPIALPPLGEQRAIAAVLDAIDEAGERTEAVVAAGEGLRDALLHELLTRGLPGRHTDWRDVPGLGTMPASWEAARLGECIADGPTNGVYKPESDYGDGTWLIRIDDFVPGALVRSRDFQRVRATDTEVERYALKKGDILINRVNSLSHLGKSVLLPHLDEPTIFESNMMRFRMRRDVSQGFVARVLLSASTKRHFAARAKKAVQQASINQRDVKDIPIPLPPLDEQRAIAAALDSVDASIEGARAEAEALRTAKASTADALLTGRVRTIS